MLVCVCGVRRFRTHTLRRAADCLFHLFSVAAIFLRTSHRARLRCAASQAHAEGWFGMPRGVSWRRFTLFTVSQSIHVIEPRLLVVFLEGDSLCSPYRSLFTWSSRAFFSGKKFWKSINLSDSQPHRISIDHEDYVVAPPMLHTCPTMAESDSNLTLPSWLSHTLGPSTLNNSSSPHIYLLIS